MGGMTKELTSLTIVAALTSVTWIPYILNRILIGGVADAVGYPESKTHSPWAERLIKAHANSVENLCVFSTLVLVANAAGVSNDITVMACNGYVYARVVHLVAYTFKIPLVRTLGFVAGFGCQFALVLQLLSLSGNGSQEL